MPTTVQRVYQAQRRLPSGRNHDVEGPLKNRWQELAASRLLRHLKLQVISMLLRPGLTAIERITAGTCRFSQSLPRRSLPLILYPIIDLLLFRTPSFRPL